MAWGRRPPVRECDDRTGGYACCQSMLNLRGPLGVSRKLSDSLGFLTPSARPSRPGITRAEWLSVQHAG